MNKGKKVWNVLGIIVSALLSILLVVMLMVSPMVMSVLSLLDPHTLVDTVKQVDLESTIISVAEENGAEMDAQQVKMVSNLLATPAAEKLMKTYAQSVFDAMGGKQTQGLTEAQLRQIVDEHNEEITAAIRDSGGEFAQMTDQELTEGIQKVIDENAGEILEMLPDPQTLKQEMVTENPQLELGMQLVAGADTVKLALIGLLVLLSLVIFFCRFVNVRGMKWLAIDLLIAGVISAVVCFSFGQMKTLLLFIAEENPLISDLMEILLGSVNTGLLVRTCVMLVVAIGLLVGYILISKNRKKKLAEAPAPVAEQKEAPAAQTPVETQPADTAEPNA